MKRTKGLLLTLLCGLFITGTAVTVTAAPPESGDCDKTRMANAVRQAIPSFPFFLESAQSTELADQGNILSWSYTVEKNDGVLEIQSWVPAPDGADGESSAEAARPRIQFTTEWHIAFAFQGPHGEADLRTAYGKALSEDQVCGDQQVSSAVFGPNSCLGSWSQKGTEDPSWSNEPYRGGARAYLALPCAKILVTITIDVYAPTAHGSRDKTNVLAALQEAGDRYIREVVLPLQDAVSGALEGAPPKPFGGTAVPTGPGEETVSGMTAGGDITSTEPAAEDPPVAEPVDGIRTTGESPERATVPEKQPAGESEPQQAVTRTDVPRQQDPQPSDDEIMISIDPEFEEDIPPELLEQIRASIEAEREGGGPPEMDDEVWITGEGMDDTLIEGYRLLAEAPPEQAAAYFRQALQEDKENPEIHMALGDVLMIQGKPAEAAEVYQSAARLDPLDPVLRLFLGEAYIELGKWAEAEVAIREAIRLDPDNGDNYGVLAMVLSEQGKYDEAGRATQRAEELGSPE